MHAIVEVTSFYSKSFRSRARDGVKLLTISQPTSWDNQSRSPLLSNSDLLFATNPIFLAFHFHIEKKIIKNP